MSWNLLKQSTAGVLKIGPLMTTAGAAATGLSLAQGDIILSKEGSTTFAAKINSAGATDKLNGMYTVPYDAVDVDTLGTLSLNINKTGAMPYGEKWTVVSADVYDALVGTGVLKVNTVQLVNSATIAQKLAKAADVIAWGTTTVGGGTLTTFTTLDITEATPDHYKGRTVTFSTGALKDESSLIQAYQLLSSPTRGQFTVAALTDPVPDSTGFVIN
jgi:hypothetical protein